MWKTMPGVEKKKIGYLLLVLLTSMMGLVLIMQMEQIVEASDKLYQHPFQVSNAAQRSKSALLQMQLIMHHLLNAYTPELETASWLKMMQQEAAFKKNVRVIEERFLGAREVVRQIQEECLRLRFGYQDVVDLVRVGHLSEGVRKEREISLSHIANLERLINEVIDFAENKAVDFHQEAVASRRQAVGGSILFVMIVSLLAAGITRRQFLHFVSMEETRKAAMATLQQTLASLSLSENRLQGIINNSNALICLKDTLGRYLLVNRRFETLFRVTNRELGNKTAFDLFPPELAASNWLQDRQVIEHGVIVEKEMVVPQEEGPRTFLAVRFPLRDDGGRLLGVGGIDTDITERKRVDDSLRKSHKLLEALFHTSHLSMAFLDREFHFVRVNRSYAEKCALDVGFFPGRNYFDLFPHPENEAIFRRVVETGTPFTTRARPFEFPDHPEWGVTYWDWTLQPIPGARGEVEWLIFELLDVTENVRNGQALQDTNRMLRTILDTIPTRVFWKDIHSRYKGCNRAFVAFAGLDTPEQIIGASDDDLHWSGRAEAFRRFDRQVIEGGEAVYAREMAIENRDGGRGWASVTKIPMFDGEGATVGVLCAATDITALKLAAEEQARLQEQAYQNDRLASLGLLAAGIAHEVNNPNNIIAVNASLLQEMWHDAKRILDRYYRDNGDFSLGGAPYGEVGETVLPLLVGIEENARRIKAIISNLKSLSQPRSTPKMQPMDLREAINRSVSFLQ
ncbi:MAG: PAS domain-containing protein, partial [Magnetococcales bacterium]|nr:PAS domain-containing protein [Magnetococcales bacterium]